MIETHLNNSNPDGLYRHIERIAGKLKNSKLYTSKLNGAQNSLKKVAEFLGCTE